MSLDVREIGALVEQHSQFVHDLLQTMEQVIVGQRYMLEGLLVGLLANGHVLLVYNDSMSRRPPLTAAISTDNDRTYAHRRHLMTGPGPFAYPVAIQTSDGKIHVIFTSHSRTVINHAVFEEQAILNPPK